MLMDSEGKMPAPDSNSTPVTVRLPLASLRNCLAAQPHGPLLAMLQEPGCVGLLNTRQPDKQVCQLPTSLGDTYRASACAWSHNGRFLLTSWHGGMGMLTVHEVSEALQSQQVVCEELFFWPKDIAVADREPGMLVALAGGPGVVLYSLQQGETEPQLSSESAWRVSQQARLSHMWPACAVSMSADGNIVAAAALGGQLSVWDLRNGPGAACLELQVQVPAERLTCMAFSPDGTSLGAVTWSGSTSLYSVQRSGEPDCEAPASGDQLGLPNAQTSAAGAQQIAPELGAQDSEGQCGSPVQAEPDHTGLDEEQCSGKAGAKSREQALLGPKRAVRPEVQAQQAAQDGLLAGGSDSKGFQVVAADAASVPGKPYIGHQRAAEAVSRLAWVDHGVRGSGRWMQAGNWLGSGPLKPQVACTSLLAWLNNSRFAVSVGGSPLIVCERADGKLRLVSKEMARGFQLASAPSEGSDLGLSGELSNIRGLAVVQGSGSDRQGSGLRIAMCDSWGIVRSSQM